MLGYKLDNIADVTDCAISKEEEQSRVAWDRWLIHQVVQDHQNLSSAHVRIHGLYDLHCLIDFFLRVL